MDSALM